MVEAEAVSANSDFSTPEFWISGGMVDRRVKPLYRHQFYTSFQAFWAKKISLLYQSLFWPNGAPLQLLCLGKILGTFDDFIMRRYLGKDLCCLL